MSISKFSIGYLPRWIIFFIDIFIVVFANTITYVMLTSLTLSFYDTLTVFQRYSLIVLINILYFLFFKTYAGIVRHSTFVDAIKLFFSTFSSFITLLTINYLSFLIFGKKIFLIPGLILSFVLSFAFLFFFRIIVKYTFENFINTTNKSELIPTIVYGSDANAIAVANALKVEIPNRFKIVAFIDKSKANKSKSILGLPILFLNKRISVILRAYRAQALIIAEKTLTKDEKLAIIDDCLEHNIKVYSVPLVTNWENEKEISKNIKNFEIQDLLERKPIVLNSNYISEQIKNKTIFITGAAGSIGSEIVRQVIEFEPAKLILIDTAETPLHNLILELGRNDLIAKISPIIADIRDKNLMEKLFHKYKPNKVYHAAAYKHVPLMEENPYQAVITNVLGTKNIADLSLKYKVDKFVMISTDKAVNPSNIMGASKRIAEIYVQSIYYNSKLKNIISTKFITTRFGNVLGSNGSVVPLFTKQIQEGGPITITHPEIIRYFMTIPEACQLVLEAGAMGNGGEIYIFDMGKPVKILDLAKKMIKLAGFTPYTEIDIKIVGLRPGEKLYEELLNDTSKTLTTHHEKILIATDEHKFSIEQVNELISNLEAYATEINDEELVKTMKIIVPEFKSLNSTYAILD